MAKELYVLTETRTKKKSKSKRCRYNKDIAKELLAAIKHKFRPELAEQGSKLNFNEQYLERYLDVIGPLDEPYWEVAERILDYSIKNCEPGRKTLDVVLSCSNDIPCADRAVGLLEETIRLNALHQYSDDSEFDDLQRTLAIFNRTIGDYARLNPGVIGWLGKTVAGEIKALEDFEKPYTLRGDVDEIVAGFLGFYRDLVEYRGEEAMDPTIEILLEEPQLYPVDLIRYDDQITGSKLGLKILRRQMEHTFYTYNVEEDIHVNGYDEGDPSRNLVLAMAKFYGDARDAAQRLNKPASEVDKLARLADKYESYTRICKSIADGEVVHVEDIAAVNGGVSMTDVETCAFRKFRGRDRASGEIRESREVPYIMKPFKQYQLEANPQFMELVDIAKKAYSDELGIPPHLVRHYTPLMVCEVVLDRAGRGEQFLSSP